MAVGQLFLNPDTAHNKGSHLRKKRMNVLFELRYLKIINVESLKFEPYFC